MTSHSHGGVVMIETLFPPAPPSSLNPAPVMVSLVPPAIPPVLWAKDRHAKSHETISQMCISMQPYLGVMLAMLTAQTGLNTTPKTTSRMPANPVHPIASNCPWLCSILCPFGE
jgi:hypothetical protein